MAILRDQALLATPSLRALIELHLDGTFPVRLDAEVAEGMVPTTAALGGGPLLISTDDVVVVLADGTTVTRGQRSISDYEPYSRTLIRACGGAATLRGYWRLGDDWGAPAMDASGNNRDGTYSGGWIPNQAGALIEDGDTSVATFGGSTVMTVPAATALDFGVTEEFTLIVWIRYAATSIDTTGTILSKRTSGGTTYAYSLTLAAGVVNFARANGSTTITLTSTTAVAPDVWHMIVVRKTAGAGGQSSVLQLWIDGTLFGSVADVTGTTTSAANVTVGNATGGGAGWVGLIDEVAIVGVALPWTVIEKLYLAGQWNWSALWEGLLVEWPSIRYAEPTELGGIQAIEQIVLRLPNANGRFDETWLREIRDKRVVMHLYDEISGEYRPNVFCGYISGPEADSTVFGLVASSVDVTTLATPVPRMIITSAQFSRLPPPPSGAGQALNYGMGVGIRVPGQYVGSRFRETDPYAYDFTFGRGNIGIAALYTNGDLAQDPTGYERLYRTYWADDATFVTAVRWTYPMVNESGELAAVTADVLACYEPIDNATLLAWKLLNDFTDDILGSDLFTDGGLTAVEFAAAVSAGVPDPGATLSDLVVGPHAWDSATGAVRLGGGVWKRWLTIPHPEICVGARDVMSCEFWVSVRAGSATAPIVTSANYVQDFFGWRMLWGSDGLDFRAWFTAITVPSGFEVGVSVELEAGSGWHHVMGCIDCRNGVVRMSVYVDGQLAGFSGGDIADATINFGNPFQLRPGHIGIDPSDLVGTTLDADFGGEFRLSSDIQTAAHARGAYYAMRRNPVHSLAQFRESQMGDTINPGSFMAVAREFDQIERGIIKCDGWLTGGGQVPARAVTEAFLGFLGLRCWRDARDQFRVDYARRRKWDYLTEVLNDGPLAYWRFEESANTFFVSDSGGYDHTGAMRLGGIQGVPGAITNTRAYQGDGNSYVDFALQPDLAVRGALTIEFWIKATGGGSHEIVTDMDHSLSVDGIASTTGGYELSITAGPVVNFSYNAVGANPFIPFTTLIPTGVWTHVALTMDMLRTRLALYFNGALVEVLDNVGGPALYAPIDTMAPVLAGGFPGGIFPCTYPLDELAIYDYALPSHRIREHYQAGLNQGADLVDAAFGVGGFWNNITGVSRRARANLAEAIGTLVLRYGTARDKSGAQGDLQFQQEFEVQAAGRPEPWDLPFVLDDATADYLGLCRAARMRARDQQLALSLGHEARALLPGQVIALDIPPSLPQGADPAATAHVIDQIEIQGTNAQVLVHPQETPITYLPPTMERAIRAANPTLFYRCDDQPTSYVTQEAPVTAEDASVNGLDADYIRPGVVMGIASPIPGDLSGSGCRLAIGGHLQRATHAALVPSSNKGFLFAVWVRFPSGINSAKTAYLCSFRGTGSCALDLKVPGSTGIPTATLVTNGGTSYTITGGTVVADGAWHFIALRVPNETSGTTGNFIHLIIDSVAVGTPGPSLQTFTTTTWFFGYGAANPGTAAHVDMFLDEIALWVQPASSLPGQTVIYEVTDITYAYYSYARPARPYPLVPAGLVQPSFALDLGDTQSVLVNKQIGGGINVSRILPVALDLDLVRGEFLYPIRAATPTSSRLIPYGGTDKAVVLQTDDGITSGIITVTTAAIHHANINGDCYYFSPTLRNHFPVLRDLTLGIMASREFTGTVSYVWGTMFIDRLLSPLRSGVGGPASQYYDHRYAIFRPPGSVAVTGFDTTWSEAVIQFATVGKPPDFDTGRWGSGRAWQPGDVAGLRLGLGCSTSLGALRITRLRLLVRSVNDVPSNFSHVRFYKTLTPQPPTENAAPIGTPTNLIGFTDPEFPNPGASLGQSLYYWARIYDSRRVPSPIIGPTIASIVA